MNTTKRLYESMYIIDISLTDEQVDSIIGKYSKIVADQGGEVKAVGRWDKRRLAYEVKGRREGLYILMFFEGEPAVAAELDRVYKISDDVFRHLITRVELDHVDTSRIDHPLPSEAPVEAPVEAEEAVAETPEAPAEEAVAEDAPEAPAEAAEEAPAEEAAAEEAEAPAEVPAAEEAPAEEPAAEETPAEAEEPEAKTEE